jgi:hypothetical protein
MSSTISKSILDFLLPAIEAHKARRWNMAPEVTYYGDDRFHEWAEDHIYKNEDASREFILKATKEEAAAVFAALTDDLWPAHRRSFASKIHLFAMELEEGGATVSKGFADFFRERYNPQYIFLCEQPVFAAGSEVPPAEAEPPSAAPAACAGCSDNQPNQLAHMYPGGCLEVVEECDAEGAKEEEK